MEGNNPTPNPSPAAATPSDTSTSAAAPIPLVDGRAAAARERARRLTKYPKILALLELVAIGSCGYGLWVLFGTKRDIYTTGSLVAGAVWFVLGAISNLCGIIGLYKVFWGPEDEVSRGSGFWVQYHYLLAWLTIVIGYPTFVILAWMSHYPTPYVYAHGILAFLPMASWFLRKTRAIVRTTQLSSVITILSHVYISYLAKQYWGIGGAALMIFNVLALSIPTKYSLLGFSSREMYVIGLSATSIIFSIEVGTTASNPSKVTSLKLWG